LSGERLPGELRSAVGSDLLPVSPLREPWARALVVLPFAMLLVAYVHFRLGMRPDSGLLGPWVLWGLTGLQVAGGLALFGVALREAVPGRLLSRGQLLAVLGGILFWLMTAVWLTWLRSPAIVPPAKAGIYWRWCSFYPFLYALPLLVVGLLLARRAFPLRPALVGALCGAGAGLIAEAGWRTYCSVSSPAHIADAHLVSIAASAAVGALAGRVLMGRR
jgi:hypothetical protein